MKIIAGRGDVHTDVGYEPRRSSFTNL